MSAPRGALVQGPHLHRMIVEDAQRVVFTAGARKITLFEAAFALEDQGRLRSNAPWALFAARSLAARSFKGRRE